MIGANIRCIRSWAEFETLLEDIKNRHFHEECLGSVSSFLFRGQCDSDWNLETTLDRFLERIGQVKKSISISEYHKVILKIYPAFASYTGVRFELPQPNMAEFDEELDKAPWNLIGYPFMIHLRHNGFPSPLLDWTKSPYVAAFFAFERASPDRDVSIYCFRDRIGRAKAELIDRPTITEHGTYVVTHDRHFRQQAAYTTCTVKHGTNCRYVSHEQAVFGDEQDILYKISLPGSERRAVMQKLDEMNINKFSLFGNEEGLMDMLSFRHFERAESINVNKSN